MTKRVICLILIVFIFVSNNAFEAEAKGKSKISYTLKNGVLTIKGKGDNIPSFKNNKSIKKVIIKKGITGIPSDTFYGCKNLKKVSLPEGLISIGSDTFYGTKVTKLVIPKSVKYMTYWSINKNIKRITWKGNVGLPEFVAHRSVYMNCTDPSIPETGKKYYLLNWKAVKGADGYEIYIGKSFKNRKLVKTINGNISHYDLRDKYHYNPVFFIRAFKKVERNKIYGPFCWDYTSEE